MKKIDMTGLRALFDTMTALKIIAEKEKPTFEDVRQNTELCELVTFIRETLAKDGVDDSKIMSLF